MDGRANIKHHFIPQCYLRKFSNTEKSIWTYDKINSKIYNSAIDNVCCIDNFYKLSEKYLRNNPQDVDKALTIECDYFSYYIEPEYNMLINKLISNKDTWLIDKTKDKAFSKDQKKAFSRHIVIQYFRLKETRDIISSAYDNSMPKLMDIFKELVAQTENDPKINEVDINIDYDPALLHANHSFLNDKLVSDFSNALSENYWSFLVSKNSRFYTSDYPIVVEPHVPDVIPENLGLTQYGAELTFPITKDILVTIWDKRYFADKKDLDCLFYFIDSKEERRQNSFRYFYAKRHVFSFHNDFKLIDLHKIINNNCHYFMGTTNNRIL